MRWKSWRHGRVGDKRIKTWFALWPVQINNDCRWLERVTVEFELQLKKHPYGRVFLMWEMVGFIDGPNHEC